MTDQLTITVSGHQGSGKTTLTEWLRTIMPTRFGKDHLPRIVEAEESYDDWRKSQAATPPVGPIKCPEDLRPGDILRANCKLASGPMMGELVAFASLSPGRMINLYNWQPRQWDYQCFSFVRRPSDAPRRGDPVEPPFGCKPKIVSPDDLRTGDRARFTIEATLGSPGPGDHWVFSHEEMADAKIELLDRPQPFKVGDLVKWDRATGKTGEIRSIDAETQEAWVRWANANNPRDYSTVKLSNLVHA